MGMPSPLSMFLALDEPMLKAMGIVGKGHHIFVAAVSKDWRRLYSTAHPALETSVPHSIFGSVECLNWAVKHGYVKLSAATFGVAARYGDVSICQALHRHNCAWNEDVCQSAAQNIKHGLSVLKWLRSEELPDKRACPWNEGTCHDVASRGNVAMLTWLLEAKAPFDEGIWAWAARGGHINVLEMLLTHPRVRPELDAAVEGGKWRRGPIPAAMGGRLGALRWLHKNARELCDWDRDVCANAVEYAKSLAVLKWLRSEGVMCPWDMRVCPEVLLSQGMWDGGRNGVFQTIKRWVHANGHPCHCED